jgi:ATP-dependent DNA helicase UvrD/PcrA
MRANPQQLKAIETLDGPLLIVAGPGAGKTFTLVERTINLLSTRKVDPSRILVSTFTEKAAKELLTRISNRLLERGMSVNPADMAIGTLHSIFLRLLEEFRPFTRIRRNCTVLDQFDQQYFFYQNSGEFRSIEGLENLLHPNQQVSAWWLAESLMVRLNKLSEEGIDGEALIASAVPEFQILGAAYKKYQELLEANNALDFSTIQVEALKLFAHEKVRNELQNRFDYLMVDEYQDTNSIQEKIVLLLGSGTTNVCVCGDDDQSLYRFRGASIRNILEFSDRFAEGACKTVYLTDNYRSHPAIVDLYNEWMHLTDWESTPGLDSAAPKSYRFHKTIKSVSHDNADRPAVFKVAGADGQGDWANQVAAFLLSRRNDGIIKDWNQVALLFRSVTNEKVVQFSRTLEREGIPIYAPRSNMFFERHEIRSMIGALLFMFPQYGSIRQVREGQQLGVWEYYDACLKDFIAHIKSGTDTQIGPWLVSMAKTHLGLSENTNYAFSGLFYQLLQFPTFSKFLGEDVAHSGVRDSRPARNLSKFSRLLNKYEYLYRVIVFQPERLERDLLVFFNTFMRFLLDGGIGEYEDESEYAPSGCVSMMTIHQSKGLEFPIVLVGSLDASPRKQHSDLDVRLQRTFDDREPFEPWERTKTFDFWRLFYTAFSRAQNMLVLTTQENTPKGKGQRNVPSAYFRPVYQSLKSWTDLVFDPNKIALADVKDVNLKRAYSFTSDVLVFEGCAQQYRFFKDLEFAPVRTNAILFGTLVHQTIEDIHKAVLRGEEVRVTPDQISSWFRVNYNNISQQERTYLAEPVLRIAEQHVQRYATRERSNWHRLKDAEIELSLLKPDYILQGTVDLVQEDDGSYEIVDFKSEKKPDMFDDKDKIDRYRRQLQIYAHLLEEKRQIIVRRMTLYYTSEEAGNPRITFDRSMSDVKGTIEVVDKVIKKIVAKDYGLYERPEKLCKNCDFRAYCDMNFCRT